MKSGKISIHDIIEKYEIYIVLLLSIFLGILTTYKMFSTENNPIFYRDFSWPSNIDALKNWLFYSWSDIGSAQNIDVLHRFPFNIALYIIAYFFGSYNSYAFLYLFITSFGFFFMYLLISFIIRKFYSSVTYDACIISSIVGAFVWIFSFTYMNSLGLELGMIFIPLSVLYFLKSLCGDISLKNIFLLSLSLSLSTGADVRYLILSSIIFSFFIFFQMIRTNNVRIVLLRIIKISIFTFLLLVLFSLYWILPTTFLSIKGQQISPPYILSEDMYDMLSSKFSPVNYIRLLGYWWPYISAEYIENSPVLFVLSFSIPLISFLSLLVIRNRDVKLLFGIILFLSLLGIILNRHLLLLPPFINWMFRTPYRWLIFLNITYSFLISVFLIELYDKDKRLFSLLVIFIIMVNSVLTFPLLTGDFGKSFSPIKSNISINFENDNSYHILFYPPIDSGRSPRDSLPYSQLFTTSDISGSSGESVNIRFFSSIINRAFSINMTEFSRKMLQAYNFRYYIIHDYMQIHSNDEKKIINYAMNDDNFKKNGTIYTYHVNDSRQFDIYPYILVKNGLDINDKVLPFVPIDYGKIKNLIPIEHNKNFYFSDSEIIFSYIIDDDATIVLKPYDYTISNDKSKGWAKTNALPYFNIVPFTDLLFDQNITHVDFDYGKGFVYTDQSKVMPYPISIVRRESPSFVIRPLEITINGTKDNWVIPFSKDISDIIRPDKFYFIRIKIKGNNVTLPHFKTVYIGNDKNDIRADIIGIGEDVKKPISFDKEIERLVYVPKDVKKIKLELWTNGLSTGSVYINSIFITDLSVLESKPKIVIPFNVEKDGRYSVFSRLFFSKIGGNITFKIDNNSFVTDTNSSENRFVWKDIGDIELSSGNHVFEMTNINGYNAINLIVFIQEGRYNDINNNISTIIKRQNENMLSIVNKTPAIVSYYIKNDPTLYSVNVDAKEPFVLSFAESYDPFWTAKIDKIDGKDVKFDTVRPIPLYSIINGFWINQTGDLDITIEYEPQRWFYIGVAISITTLIICTGYLIYDWRKRKNV